VKITLLDTKTGETVTVEEDVVTSPYVWAEGNWSDDCNRVSYFGEKIEDEMETEFGENVCMGAKRFLVIYPLVFEDEEHRYDLMEVNESYPQELLDKYIKPILEKASE